MPFEELLSANNISYKTILSFGVAFTAIPISNIKEVFFEASGRTILKLIAVVSPLAKQQYRHHRESQDADN